MIYQVVEVVEVNGHYARHFVTQSAIRWQADARVISLAHCGRHAFVSEVS